MSRSHGLFWGVLIVAIVAALWYRHRVFSDPPAPEPARVAFLTGGPDAFWQVTEAGAQAAAEEYGVDLKIFSPEHAEDTSEQSELLLRLGRDKFDGIAISPLNARKQTKLINQIVNTIPVVTFDSDAPLSNRAYYVGASNYGAGQLCYELMAEAVEGGGKIVVLATSLGKENVAARKLGIEESIEAHKSDDLEDPIEIVEVLVDEGDREKCAEQLRQAVQSHPDLAGVVALNGYHGGVILEVLEEVGKLGQTKVVAFDTAEATLDGIEAGHIYGTVAQDPFMYGYEAVRVLTRLHAGDAAKLPLMGGGEVNVPCEAVRKEGLADLRKRLKSRDELRDQKSEPSAAATSAEPSAA